MRNNLGGFFVLGFMLPCVGLTGLILFNFAVGHSMRLDEAAATIVGTALFYWIARMAGAWMASNTCRQRPHALFTPLYEKRPHEQTCGQTWRPA